MARRLSRDQLSDEQTRAAIEERWADFADLVLEVAREIQFRGYTSAEAVSLSPSEGNVMRQLFRQPGIVPSQVADATGLQRSNLSTVLRGLEEKGLIERVPDADDGRSVRIHPTPRAVRNYAVVRHEWAGAMAAAADGDTTGLEAAIALLAKVDAGLVGLGR